MNFASKGLAGFLVCVCCSQLLAKEAEKKDMAPYRELEIFARVLHYIDENYVDQVDSKELITGAVKGMLHTLDPHSAYMPPRMYKDFREDTSGQFGGVGIELGYQDKVLTVIAPIEDSPAFKAGVLAGDKIVKINGKITRQMSIPDAAVVLKGKPGSNVVLTIKRDSNPNFIDIKVKRSVIKISTVKSTLFHDDTGYIRINSFGELTAKDVAKAIDKLQEKKTIHGLVLDLRGNPGGLLDQGIRVANLFIDEGPIVYTISRDKSKKEVESALRGRRLTKLPLVVLVDGSSASASEIVAGALQDYGRGIIAGQRTFGKGSVQSVIPLSNDAGLKLTVARYYTPSGRSIQAKGIEPDVPLDYVDEKTLKAIREQNKTIREKDLEGHFENEAESSKSAPPVISAQTRIAAGLENDYMFLQARGILKTMSIVRDGKQKVPEFKLQEEKAK
ncbi:MAG: S41 family peptidase [Bdellovibrionota bacterium]